MKNEAILEDAQMQIFAKEREEGRAEVLAEGQAKGQTKIIKSMLKRGMNAEQMAAVTSVDLNSIYAIQVDS